MMIHPRVRAQTNTGEVMMIHPRVRAQTNTGEVMMIHPRVRAPHPGQVVRFRGVRRAALGRHWAVHLALVLPGHLSTL